MDDQINEYGTETHGTRNVLLSLLIGGLAGATAMWLFAPQSGKRTRDEIQLRGVQLRDWTVDLGKRTVAQARTDTQELATGMREKAGPIKHFGQAKLVHGMDRLSSALDASKAAVEAA